MRIDGRIKSRVSLKTDLCAEFSNMAIDRFTTTAQWLKWNRYAFELFPYLRRKVEICCFLLTRQVYGQIGLLCRSSHEMLTKMAARLLEVRRRLPVAFFFVFT